MKKQSVVQRGQGQGSERSQLASDQEEANWGWDSPLEIDVDSPVNEVTEEEYQQRELPESPEAAVESPSPDFSSPNQPKPRILNLEDEAEKPKA